MTCVLQNFIGSTEYPGGAGCIDDLAPLEDQDADPLLYDICFHGGILAANLIWHNDNIPSIPAIMKQVLIASSRMRKLQI